jgi:hypothetical protein
MPIPTPKPNEAEGSFMSRCIRFVIDEGTPQEQAMAICSSQYRKEKLKVMTWKTIDRKRASYIKYAKTEFSRALKTQANEYLDQVKQSGLSAEYSISRAPIENAMFNVYSKVMTQFARDTFSDLSKRANKTEVNWDEWVARWFTNNTTDLIRGIDEYTQNGIRAIAERAIIEGWGIREFQNALFDDYRISERRAELIGRTEIIRASNAGSLMGAQETGFPMMKYWLATRDNRTRGLNPKDIYDHYSMDEDKGIPLDQAFNVSGEQLQHPGDRAGSPGNTINCRCTMTYQLADEIEEQGFAEAPIQEPIVQTPTQEDEFTSYNPVDAKYQPDFDNDKFYDIFSDWYVKAKAPGEYRNWDNRNNISPDAPTIQGEFAKLQGFKGKPSIISDAEYQKLLDDDNYTIVYRGLADTKTLTADELVRQYKYGEMFDGVGVYGDGTYFAGRTSKIIPDGETVPKPTALVYADDKNENIIAGAFRKSDAHIVEDTQIYEYMSQFRRQLDPGGKIRKRIKKKYNFTTDRMMDMPEEARKELSILYDLTDDSMFAEFSTMLGFDGMHVQKRYSPTGLIDIDFYVIFNRTKLFINNKNGY